MRDCSDFLRPCWLDIAFILVWVIGTFAMMSLIFSPLIYLAFFR